MAKLLSLEMLDAARAYTAALESTVALKLNAGEHEKKKTNCVSFWAT